MLPKVVDARSKSPAMAASHAAWYPVLFLAALYGPQYLAALATMMVGKLRRKRTKNAAAIELRKLNHAVRLAGESVQELVEHFVVFFQDGEPRVEARIGRRKLREVGVILPVVMAVQIVHQCTAVDREARRVLLVRTRPIEKALSLGPIELTQPTEHLVGTEPVLCRLGEVRVVEPGGARVVLEDHIELC